MKHMILLLIQTSSLHTVLAVIPEANLINILLSVKHLSTVSRSTANPKAEKSCLLY